MNYEALNALEELASRAIPDWYGPCGPCHHECTVCPRLRDLYDVIMKELTQ